MTVGLTKIVLASVVLPEAKDLILSGGTGPIFIARDSDEQQRIAMYISRICEGVIHDLENGILIIVRH
jgi:hypothetical protein